MKNFQTNLNVSLGTSNNGIVSLTPKPNGIVTDQGTASLASSSRDANSPENRFLDEEEDFDATCNLSGIHQPEDLSLGFFIDTNFRIYSCIDFQKRPENVRHGRGVDLCGSAQQLVVRGAI